MPTFAEISKTYADQIKRALASDGFTVNTRLTEAIVRDSEVVQELKRIAAHLETWTIGNEPLTDAQKEQIKRGISEQLNLSDSAAAPRMVKNASNDAYMDLVTDIGRLLNPKK